VLREKNRLQSWENPSFEAGVVIRLVLIVIALPATYTEWFLPFLTSIPQANQFDVWSAYLERAAAEDFPYGALYVLVFAPATLVGQALAGVGGAAVGLGLTVFALDALLFAAIRRLVDPSERYIATYAYWLSPIPIYCLYWHGQLDVLPVLLVTAAFVALRRRRFAQSACALIAAVAAKFSMGVALPFFGVYTWADRRHHPYSLKFLRGAALGALTATPFLVSPGLRDMAFTTPETLKVFSLKIVYGAGFTIYVLPLAMIALAYAAWRIRRYDFYGLLAFVGLAFFVLFLLTPASPGWAMWVAPFVAVHCARHGGSSLVLAMTFGVAVVVFHLLVSTGPLIFGALDLTAPLGERLPTDDRLASLVNSAAMLTGVILSVQIFRKSILASGVRRFRDVPVLIAIAGDSGAGKDTLSNALTDVFGAENTTQLSGDDYHHWDRKHLMWHALTHLDPQSNDLARLEADVATIKKGQPIRFRRYDHRTGRSSKPRSLRPSDFAVLSGLHALFTPRLRGAADLKIFMDMDEGLRRRLKTDRDVCERGYLPETVERAFAVREPDSEKYVRPQKSAADLVFKLAALRPGSTDEFVLTAEFDAAFDIDALYRLSLALLDVDVRRSLGTQGRSQLAFRGPFAGVAVGELAAMIAPNALGLASFKRRWAGGVSGLMQLCVLVCLEQRLADTGGGDG